MGVQLMYEMVCQCEWIPGRPGFNHTHRTRTRFRTTDVRQLEIETTTHILPQRGVEILEQEDVVLIWVDWKRVVRELQG